MMLDRLAQRRDHILRFPSALQNICRFAFARVFARLLRWCHKDGACDVDLALRLDVLAICAVFAFVGAILLGAF